jgi:hypothetical protein
MAVSLVSYETATPWIARLLAEAATERIDIATFTDEELTALDGEDGEQVAPTPWLDTCPADHRELAASVALRGLIARGLVVRVEEHQEGDDRTVLSMPDEVLAVLAMRRSAASITIAEQRTSLGSWTRVLYRHADGLLEENVNAGGLHTFSLLPLPVAVADLARWCDPHGAAGDTDSSCQTVPLTDVARGEGIPSPLTESLVVTVLVGVGPGIGDDGEPVQTRATVYAAPGKVHVADPASEPGNLRIREASADTLHSAVNGVVEGRHA